MDANKADYPPGTPGDDAAQEHADIIAEMQTGAATQVSETGEASQAFDSKDDFYDAMLAMIKHMNMLANGFADEIPGSDLLFRVPRNRSQANIRATAVAFHEDSVAPYEAKFIAYGMAATFRADLQALIDGFDTADVTADTSVIEKAGATGGLKDAAKRGMTNSTKLNGIVRVKYQNNPQQLAAWTVASHLEKPPKKKETP
jgi:hypothetical protein